MPRAAFIFLLLLAPTCFAADEMEESRGDTYLTLIHFRDGEHTAGLGGAYHEIHRARKAGIYVGYFVSFSSRDPSYEFAGGSGDPVLDMEEDVTMFNVGGSRLLTDRFALYIGGGLGWTQGHAQKYDATRTLSDDGIYYVEVGDEFGLNANAGLLYAGEDVMFQVGYNSFGKSYYLGVGFSFEGT